MPTARTILLTLCLLAAGLAGCMGGDGSETGSTATPSSTNATFGDANETNETDVPEDTGPNVTLHWSNATVAGQDLPDPLGWYCQTCQNNFMTFNATNETTGIVAQAYWNASVELDFDLDVPPEPCETNFPTDGDCQPDMKTGQSPLEYRVTRSTDLYAGEWETEVWPENNIDEPVEVTVVVSVFNGDDVPSRWSKIPS